MKIFAILILLVFLNAAQILDPIELKPYMFTDKITGNIEFLKPTNYGISSYWNFPVQIYEISMMRARHQFLPSGFPDTEIFAYAGKVNGVFKPSFPGPAIEAFKNMPIYVSWTNNITGKHIFPIDTSPPFDMISQFQDEVPVVPHAHGLQTQMGPDGQPMGFWTKSGRKGRDFFSLNFEGRSNNQAIFRYHNTKEGLLWYHDHSMAITRLNVYAGLLGYYQIIDPYLSSEQRTIMMNVGELERKYFLISDRTFNKNGQLFYPDQSESSDYEYWVPQFFGNTIVVNGKVWPKVELLPKIYRFIFLNACQSRFLNIYFEYQNRKLEFEIFRRDSDYVKKPVKVKQHLLLLGGRIQIFVDFTGLSGNILLKNDAETPYPMGDKPDQFTSNVMQIVLPRNEQIKIIEPQFRVKQISINTTLAPSLVELINKDRAQMKQRSISKEVKVQGKTLTAQIQERMNLYLQNTKFFETSDTLKFLDKPQSPNYNSPQNKEQKTIGLIDFLGSNKGATAQALQNIVSSEEFAQPDLLSTIKNNIQNQLLSLVDLSKKLVPKSVTSTKKIDSFIINKMPFPRFAEGTPYFFILSDVQNDDKELSSVMIDGIPIKMGCQGATFKEGQTYDFYIINLTMDDHPIHIHLVNFQIIKRFKFDLKKYRENWQSENGALKPGGIGRIPAQIDVRDYKVPNTDEQPLQEQKLFTDVIVSPAEMVTVARIRFSNHLGKPFPFDIAGARYVWHCHILEHQDNQMMRYFCIE